MAWNRRQFLSGATALIAAHAGISGAAPGSRPAPEAKASTPDADGGDPRILALRLACAAPLTAMRDFYRDTLGLPILAEDAASVTVAGGSSRITFVAAEPADGEPFYHFAFNIPENKILLARGWQLRRTRIIPPPPHLRDPDLPDDVVDYRHWNAHSVFFWDPAGNLLEYIARHDLGNAAPGPFTVGDILYASEIGFIVDDIDATAAELKETFAFEQYRGGSDAFRAIGDERGLLLAMRTGRMLGFDEAKPAAVFPTEASLRGVAPARYTQPGLPYEIVAG
jgi:catechol 2,3-dioxygenase-like lactoylglutathione lyase family enzyme